MDITYIPKGSMCMVCYFKDEKCNHLKFEEYQQASKPDEEGYVFVICKEFINERHMG